MAIDVPGGQKLKVYLKENPTAGWISVIAFIALLGFGFYYYLYQIPLVQMIFASIWANIGIVAIILVVVFALSLLKGGGKKSIMVTLGVLILIMLFFAYVQPSPAYSQVQSDVLSKLNIPFLKESFDKTKGFTQGFITNQTAALDKILPTNLARSKVQEPAKRTLSADFPKIYSNDPTFNMDSIIVKVTTEEDLSVIPNCMVNGKDAIESVSSLEFKKGTSEKFFGCSANEKGKSLTLKLSAPFTTKSVLPVTVGGEDDKSGGSSIMDYGGPFDFRMGTVKNQPLQERADSYPFRLDIIRKESGVKLKSIESLEISVKSPYINLECRSPFEGLRFSASEEQLKELMKDKESLQLSCGINVVGVPSYSTNQLIVVDAKYTVEKEVTKSL